MPLYVVAVHGVLAAVYPTAALAGEAVPEEYGPAQPLPPCGLVPLAPCLSAVSLPASCLLISWHPAYQRLDGGDHGLEGLDPAGHDWSRLLVLRRSDVRWLRPRRGSEP